MKNIREDFTKGQRQLGTIFVEVGEKPLEVEFFKSKSRNEDKMRFLVWLPQHNKCVLVWRERSCYHMSDVSNHEGKNCYSYADAAINKIIGKEKNSEIACRIMDSYLKNFDPRKVA